MTASRYESLALVLLLASLGCILLVGNRLHAAFAGGDGYKTHTCAMSENEIFCRGQIISTMEGHLASPLELTIGDAQLFLDQNTEVELIDGRPGQETISLIQGRVVIKGNLNVSIRDMKINVDGTTSLVHYSWMDLLDISSIAGTTTIAEDDETIDASLKSIQTSTLPPYNSKEVRFSASESSAADFYNAVLK
ncbi:MAG: hypothetical protein WCT24_01135 [Patescibacteria group bacterium]